MASGYVDLAVGASALLGAGYAFYTGVLPRWVKGLIGFYDLKEDVQGVKADTESLKQDHAETIEEMQTLKHGQVALAEAVQDEHGSVRVDALREAHFGEESRSGDFLRGGEGVRSDD